MLQPLKFGDVEVISSHTLLDMWLIIIVGIKVNLSLSLSLSLYLYLYLISDVKKGPGDG